MNVVTDVRTTQRTCKRTSGRTRDVRVDGRVRASGLISVRLNLPNTKYVRKNRDVQK